jgi:exopolyphosphatase / guanosine-5'-triphosphate,3'-diphosphate pyrophosphatase
LAAPVQLAAIDAGSNAIRLVIARATALNQYEILDTERAAVRLGHLAFTKHKLNRDTISDASRVFRQFRRLMDRHHVSVYRAVATSAAREARNRKALINRIHRKSGLDLEVISGQEEARLVCSAVLNRLGPVRPRLIFDLGGGSLEMNFLRQGALERRVALPLGTVRLMETYRIQDAISEDTASRIRDHVLMVLRSALPNPPRLPNSITVACGGNAEALAALAAGPRVHGFPTINVRLMRDQAWKILPLDIPARARVFRIRRDRAEVMGIASIVLVTVARYLNVHELLIPGVGVREGILLDLIAAQYSGLPNSLEERRAADRLRAGAEWFARKFAYDARHADHVRQIALSIFDQLRPLHELDTNLRSMLEIAAILHDVGNYISRKAHHRHGEYLVGNGEIPTLNGWQRDMVAALVRYHNCKSEPDMSHKFYAALDSEQRHQTRLLASILRIAEKLEGEHRAAPRVAVDVLDGEAIFRVQTESGRLDVSGLAKKAAALFGKEFHLYPVFRRVPSRQSKQKVA